MWDDDDWFDVREYLGEWLGWHNDSAHAWRF